MDIKEKRIIEAKNKENAENRARIKKLDERDKEMILPRKYKDKTVWVEITDEEIFETVFPKSEHHCLAYFYVYWYFAKRNNKMFNLVPEYIKQKKELLEKYKKEITEMVNKRQVNFDIIDSFTIFELEDFLTEKKIIVVIKETK